MGRMLRNRAHGHESHRKIYQLRGWFDDPMVIFLLIFFFKGVLNDHIVLGRYSKASATCTTRYLTLWVTSSNQVYQPLIPFYRSLLNFYFWFRVLEMKVNNNSSS